MTTYQDPPLQSRRAVRQGERVDPPFTPPQTPRTAAGAGEPLSYVTQNRPPLPGYDTPPAHGRRSSAPPPQDQPESHRAPEPQNPAEAQSLPEAQPAQSFRPRDYSPEARTAPPAWVPDYDRESGVLDHHTQVRPPAESHAAESHAAGSLAASLASEPSEQTLTRRELRAIRDTAHVTDAPTDAAPAVESPVQYSQPTPAPQQQAEPPSPAPSRQLDSAMAEFDALAGRTGGGDPSTSRRAGRRAAPNPDVAPEDGIGAFDAIFAAPEQQLPQAEPRLEQPEQRPAQPAPAEQYPVVLPPQAAPAPADFPQPAPVQYQQPTPVEFPPPAPQQQAPQQQAPQQQAPQPVVLQQPAPQQPAPALPAPPEPVVSTTGERAAGHWTNQSDIDDRIQVNPSTVSRRVGSGAITTSALVLPQIPGQNMSTGEVMLTDSISLPSAMAATGAHSPIDESDIDHLLDPGDHQMVNTDSVPIRAIRAVSSHTGSRNQLITHNKPTHGNRALTALIVSASGMVVVVVTLLVVALATEVI